MRKKIQREQGKIYLLLLILTWLIAACSWNESGEVINYRFPEIIDNSYQIIYGTDIELSSGNSCVDEAPSGCSVFTISKGDQVFFGGNDDYILPDSYYWVDPGSANQYGVIWIGKPDNVQQGVNEKGLAYDANGLPRIEVNPHSERERVGGDYSNYPIRIMHECATVEEVIEWVNSHQRHPYMHDQLQFADATGDAVIISAGKDGEIVFTRKPAGDGYLVSTNFNVANPSNGFGYPCWRYDTASGQLQELVDQDNDLTAQDAASVLDAVHVEEGSSWTIESMVADLPNGIVYLYYFHQFDKPLVLNVADELANPRTRGPLSKLFPAEVKQEATRRFEQIISRRNQYEVIGKAWLGCVLVSLLIVIIGSTKNLRGLIFWIPTVVILGPIGLLFWVIAGRKQNPARWQMILIESAGDVMPSVLVFVMIIVALVLNLGFSDILTLLLLVFCPILVGWLVFQSLLLSISTGISYGRMLLQRMPHTWVVANLGMAGIIAVAMPIVNKSLQIPLPFWLAISWFVFSGLGAIVGMLLLSLYHAWGTKHGYLAWSSFSYRDEDVTSVTWKKGWWWIPLSYVFLFGGIAVFIILQQL